MTCKRCGAAVFKKTNGGGRTRYCVDCRVLVMEENHRKNENRRFRRLVARRKP